MRMHSADSLYWTIPVQDNRAGFAGVRVLRERLGETSEAAEVLFWDAAGSFAVKTLEGDVPLEVIEAAAAEARQIVAR